MHVPYWDTVRWMQTGTGSRATQGPSDRALARRSDLQTVWFSRGAAMTAADVHATLNVEIAGDASRSRIAELGMAGLNR
jgi:hypothetical protein